MASDDVGGIIRQSYVIRDDLDMAVPVIPRQDEFRLADNTAIKIDEQEVITVFYDETGYASGAAEGFNTTVGLKPISSKKGIAIFVQSFVVTDDLERSIPIRPDQTEINLLGSDFYSIKREEVVEVFYGEKGQAIFHRFRDSEVRPGPPTSQEGVGIWSVSHQVFPDGTASVIASKTLLQYVGQDNVHTVLFDSYGKAVCVRLPDGDIIPEGLKKRGGVNKVEFYYVPTPSKGMASAQRIQRIVGSHIELMNGKRLEVHPDEISVVLLDVKSRDLGVLLSHRRPSYVPGPASSALPGLNRGGLSPQERFPVSRSKNCIKKTQLLSSTSSSDDDGEDVNQSVSNDKDSENFIPSHQLRHSRNKQAMNRAVRNQDSLLPFGTPYKTQLYVDDIGMLIPVKSPTSKVRLGNNLRVPIKKSSLIRAEYDKRGLLVRLVDALGNSAYWPFSKPGMGIKVQDYLIHDSLLYAVPITYGQTDIDVSDGTRLTINPESVVTVYYCEDGEIGFYWQNGKLLTGRFDHPGVARRIDLMYAMDCSDNTDDTFVIPLKAPFKSVIDPNDPKSKRTVVVDPQEVYIIMQDAFGTALYFQLCDGTLMAGGLEGLGEPVDLNDHEKGGHHRNIRFERRRPVNPQSCSRRHLSSQSAASITSSLRAQAKVDVPVRGDDMSSRMASFASGTIGSSNPFSMRSQSSTTRRREVIERRVAVEQIEVVEKIVEIPEVRIVEKRVEVEKIEYEIKYVKKKEIVERLVEHVTYIPKIEKKIVERCINVPQIIEVPREEVIEVKVPVDNFIDTKQEVIVQQKLTPLVTDATEMTEEVECLELQPVVIPVILYVPKLVRGMMVACGTVKEEKTELNSATMNSYEKLPVLKTESGSIPTLSKDVMLDIQPPTDEEVAQLLQEAGLVHKFASEEERLPLPAEDKELSEEDMWKHFSPPKTTALV